jgi:hypothetical protein
LSDSITVHKIVEIKTYFNGTFLNYLFFIVWRKIVDNLFPSLKKFGGFVGKRFIGDFGKGISKAI